MYAKPAPSGACRGISMSTLSITIARAMGCTPCSPLTVSSPMLSSFEAHKRQPSIEKRFEQTQSVFEIAPVLLKNEGRVEALFFVYFLVLLVQALIERELRRAMQRQGVESLPLYPENAQRSAQLPNRSSACSASCNDTFSSTKEKPFIPSNRNSPISIDRYSHCSASPRPSTALSPDTLRTRAEITEKSTSRRAECRSS
jgi:hypothetical protein